MLSAIAARKAALAARPGYESQQGAIAAPETRAEKPPAPKAILKQKFTAQPRPGKRKKKVKRGETKNQRYFAQRDAFEDQEDIMVLGSDEGGSSEDPELAPSTSRTGWPPSSPLHDSSDDEAEEITGGPGVAPQNPPVEETHILSTYQPTLDQNLFFLPPDQASDICPSSSPKSPATLIAIRHGERICLLGTFTFCVLQGSLTFSGVAISASRRTYRVFAPRSSPLPTMEGAAGEDTILDPTKISGRFHYLAGSSVTLVLLQELPTGIEGLGLVCRTFDGVFTPSRFQKDVPASLLQLPGVFMVTQKTKDIQTFSLHPSWESALSSMSTELPVGVHLIKGPKKSGKSTFARTLVNKLLTQYQRVAFLECDLGQSEFTPGGMVALNIIQSSLFGPPFTHPTLPNFAHYIGAATPRSSPSHYLAAIQALLDAYRLDVQTPDLSDDAIEDDTRVVGTIPIVVNTMGWNKGLGADLTQKIEEIVEPTDIYDFGSSAVDVRWPALPQTQYPTLEHDRKLHVLEPVPISVLSTNYTSADHRSLAIISYFHSIFANTAAPRELNQVTAMEWTTALPLCARPPYEVDCAQTFKKVVLTGAGMEDVVPSEIERVLNGAIVGLVTSDDPGTSDLDVEMAYSASGSSMPYVQGSPVPSPSTSTCHGLALLRSVSPTSSKMHVLTPLPHALLARSQVLVKGEMELPIWGMLDFRAEDDGVAGVEKSGGVPYLQWRKGEGIGAEKRRVRRNLMRKGQA